jgi:creatinine amidohydrolase
VSVQRLADLTFDTLAGLDKSRLVAILPVGATEAHGPHLPLATDVIIAEAMAREGARRLNDEGVSSLLLPALAYTSAGYAAGFPGTISIRAETTTALLLDIAASLARHGVGTVALANAHLEPGHVASLHDAVARADGVKLVFPDVTRKPWAVRLTEEFKSGACHAGQYEGSIVMAERPDLVNESVRRGLEDNPASLSRAIRDGKRTFEEAGGPRAYFGYPARASAEEGASTVATLGQILAEAVLAALSTPLGD